MINTPRSTILRVMAGAYVTQSRPLRGRQTVNLTTLHTSPKYQAVCNFDACLHHQSLQIVTRELWPSTSSQR